DYTPGQTAPVLDGRWHVVTALRQGDACAVYVDAVPLAGFPVGVPAASVSTTSRLCFGAPAGNGPVGGMDGLSLWSRALGTQEIISGTPSRDKLVGQWLFADGTTADTSAFGNGGTLEGGARVERRPRPS
ncbi:MAG: LamG domain-containing protein, partial [Magnetospirillum sp.]|nr:LamG domain-containing protein [Magnetospirillum sp.]